uniref:HMG box domain-containing protein n=1 Tax=Rhodnius prolixus TaxID=13249 RepID=T1HE23_RHOPR
MIKTKNEICNNISISKILFKEMDTPGRSCYRTRRNHANGYRPYNRLPIRPRKPFFFFRNCERDKIILEYPTITMRLLNMLIKEKWNELSQEEQNSYKKMAALDRARYEEVNTIIIMIICFCTNGSCRRDDTRFDLK